MLALLSCNRTSLIFALLALLAFTYFFRVFLVPGSSSSPNKCFDQRDCEVPNFIQFEVQPSTRNHPTSSWKFIFKYLIANAHLIGCIYATSVAPSGYLIIWGLILMWLITLTVCSTLEEAFLSWMLCLSLLALQENPKWFLISFDPAEAQVS